MPGIGETTPTNTENMLSKMLMTEMMTLNLLDHIYLRPPTHPVGIKVGILGRPWREEGSRDHKVPINMTQDSVRRRADILRTDIICAALKIDIT